MKKNLLVLLLIILIGINYVNSRRSGSKNGNLEEEEDFSEFDSMLDEEESIPLKRSSNNNALNDKKKNDFTEYNGDNKKETDADDEDFEEDSEDSNNFSFQSNDESRPDKSSEKINQANKEKKTRGSSFNNMNVDDLDMEEFEHFIDDEEFESFESTKSEKKNTKTKKSKLQDDDSIKQEKKMPTLKIADVPIHLMQNGNWINYIYEIVLLVFIILYFVNFLYGKSKNYRLVYTWFQSHRELLERNFSVVGDDGNSLVLPGTINSETSLAEVGSLIKDSEHSYALWCTGRQMCDGMLIQLKLIKRQDFINGVLMQFIKPKSDQIVVSVEYPNHDDIDNFVFCLTNKKRSASLFNDYQDLSTYCLEKKTLPLSGSSFSGDYKYADSLNSNVASKYTMLNESVEIPNAILDMRVCAFLNKYPDMIEYLLISDQYVGIKSASNEESQTPTETVSAENSLNANGLPRSRCMLSIVFNIPGKGFKTTSEEMEKMHPAIQLALYLIDKVPRIRLSKDAKIKALKRRKDVSEQFMKLSHKQRQEAAMLRKEERRRAEKEKIMNESDPEKQKRLEEKQTKLDKKKSLSKMKQVKIKSM